MVAALLALVGCVRFLSYSRTSGFNDLAPWGLRWMLYDPTSYLNVQFFKILATPSVVAGQYFVFRLLNRGHRGAIGSMPGASDWRNLDFESPLLRLVLTSLVTLCWIVLEFAKFHIEGFYPSSALESRAHNLIVLGVSQAISFWGMKYLSFEPLFASGPPAG